MKVGIDFGSTYSMLSVYDASTDKVEAISLEEGEPSSIPSVVSISKKTGKATCGKGAKDQMGKKTVRIFEAFKMLLTETNQEMLRRRGYDEEYTPRRITKYYLESLLRGVMARQGANKLEDVVICVPEIWGKNVNTLDGRSILREILLNEVDIPIDHIRVVTEPEAASAFFAYNYEKETGKTFNGHLLLIDYGGGTLDITLTEVQSDGRGKMEIGYREGGGAGENHPDHGGGIIGSAGIAFMQDVVLQTLLSEGIVEDESEVDYTSPAFVAAVRDLETQMKNADRMKDIEDAFGIYGSRYSDLDELMEDDPDDFVELEYEGDEIVVTYQQLLSSYKNTIEQVVIQQIEDINARVREHIHADPCDLDSGIKDNFKIALVGGFGSFYLVKKQVAEIYNIDANDRIDLRTKNIAAGKREQAISLGAALLASQKVISQKTARYSIGLYTAGADKVRSLHYGIKYHQVIEPGKPYFICDENGSKITFGALYGNINHFAIEFTDDLHHGGLMVLKPAMLERLREIPTTGFWNCGFSMDESDIVSFHVIQKSLSGHKKPQKQIVIQLDSYMKMFDLTAVKEVTTS